MLCEITDYYFNIFFDEIYTVQIKKTKCYLGTRVWVPKLVYWSPKQPGPLPIDWQNLLGYMFSPLFTQNKVA